MLTLFQPFEKEEERKESWFVLGRQIRLEVVEDEKACEEEEASKEDRGAEDCGPVEGGEEEDIDW